MVLLRSLLGAALRSARRRKGLTLRDVAASAGVSLGYAAEVERGQKEPSSEVLADSCAALGLRLSDLLVGGQVELQAEEVLRREERRRGLVVHQLAGTAPASITRHRLARTQLRPAERPSASVRPAPLRSSREVTGTATEVRLAA